MKQIRIRIIDLLEQHKDNYCDCKGCAICTEIQALSKGLNRDSAIKFSHILAKGQDMTKSDLAFLVDNNVPVAVMRKAVKLNHYEFTSMMINFGLSQRQLNKGRNKEMAKITLEEYQDLKAQGRADKAIALDKGMNIQYLSQLKKKWDIRPALSLTAGIKPSESVTAKEDKTAEYERLITELREAKQQTENYKVLYMGLEDKVEELESLHAACEDVESETASLREEHAALVKQGHHDSYIINTQKYQLEKRAMEAEALQEENKALKYFARKYLAE